MIDTSKPSRELDALVAEKVMGEAYRPYAQILTTYPSKSVPETPFYSSDIAAAWQVVEKLRSMGKSFILSWDARPACKSYYCSNHDGENLMTRGFSQSDEYIDEEADSAPLAICLAALKAVGVLA